MKKLRTAGKALLALIVMPFALAAVAVFMLITFGKMAVERLG